MIIARFFCVLALSFLPSLVVAKTNIHKPKNLLTYDQFLSLSDAQKLNYIDAVRILARDLSLNPHFISEADRQARIKFDRFVALWLGQAQAAEEYENIDRVCATTAADARNLSDQDLLSAFGLTLNCREVKSKLTDHTYYRPVTIPRVEALSAEFFRRLESHQITPRTKHYGEAIGALQAAISEIKQNGTRTQQVSSSWLSEDYNRLVKLDQEKGDGYTIGRKTSKGKTNEAPPASSATRPNDTASGTTSTSPVATPAPNETASAKANEHEFQDNVQCLYAGFVIPKNSGNKCLPYTKLPFTGDFFNADTFICPQAQQILCNPMLFGYEETNCKASKLKTCDGKRPICVYRSQDATKNCFEQAKRKKTLNKTMELWKSPEGEKLYTQYIESLENLCDSGHLQKRKLRTAVYDDITKTCDVAFAVLKENIQSEYLPAKLSPADKSSGKR